jgi:5-methylcytosine-specific restriction protein A
MAQKPPKHQPPRAHGVADGRRSAARRGYDHRWRLLRLAVLADRPVCEACQVRASEHVDHVLAMSKGGAHYDPANLRALCHGCHSRKTVAEDGGFGRRPK